MQLAISKVVSISVIAAGVFTGLAVGSGIEESGEADRVELIRGMVGQKVAPELWWVVPLDAKWSNFKFIEITKAPKDSIFEMMKAAEFSRTAGDFYLFDERFEYSNETGQGFLVLVDPSKKDSIGLRFRAIATNKRALEFVSIQKFQPKRKEIEFKFDYGMKGIVLKGEFRSVLLKHREEVLASEGGSRDDP